MAGPWLQFYNTRSGCYKPSCPSSPLPPSYSATVTIVTIASHHETHPWRGLDRFPTHPWGCYKPAHPTHKQRLAILFANRSSTILHMHGGALAVCSHSRGPATSLLAAPHPSHKNKARACPAPNFNFKFLTFLKKLCLASNWQPHHNAHAWPGLWLPLRHTSWGATSPLPIPSLQSRRPHGHEPYAVTSIQHSLMHGGTLVAVLHTRSGFCKPSWLCSPFPPSRTNSCVQQPPSDAISMTNTTHAWRRPGTS
jgi:hypothetical protein